MDVLEILQDIFREVFDRPELQVTENTGPKDVAGWDSVAHIKLVFLIQERFGVEFEPSELAELRTAKDICDAVARQRGGWEASPPSGQVAASATPTRGRTP